MEAAQLKTAGTKLTKRLSLKKGLGKVNFRESMFSVRSEQEGWDSFLSSPLLEVRGKPLLEVIGKQRDKKKSMPSENPRACFLLTKLQRSLENGVFECFVCCESDLLPCWNLDSLSSHWVYTHTSLGLAHL